MSSGRGFKLLGILWIVGVVAVGGTYALEEKEEEKKMADMDTELLGGMTTLMPEGLVGMHKPQKVPFLQDYILHARGGKLTKVAVEKSVLPHDPKGHVQAVLMALGPDGAVYVNQAEDIMCKSTDGGRTWTSYQRDWPGEYPTGNFQILNDGTFITVTGGGVTSDPGVVWASSDEGRSWQKISEIELPPQYNEWYPYGLFHFPNDTLLCGIGAREPRVWEGERYVSVVLSGTCPVLTYRSSDGGRTWEGPSKICDRSGEGGIARTASGKLLAVLRYQRSLLPDDPPDLLEKTGASKFGSKYPYKHIFLADSYDEGRTWQNLRQLTTVFGQCYGFPAALSDGTVVVIHDHRYPRGLPGRAMISYDEGETWEDEVYFVYYGTAMSGYSQSVVLEGDVILTIAGTTNVAGAAESWGAATGHTTITAIRWKPVRD